MSPSPVYLSSAEANTLVGKNCHIHLTFSQIMSLRFAVIRYNYTTRDIFGTNAYSFKASNFQFLTLSHFVALNYWCYI